MENVFKKLKFTPHGAWTQIFGARILAVVLPTIFIFGCAHTPTPVPKCSGVFFHSPTEIDACVNKDGVKVGDRVVFLKSKCPNPSRLKHQHQCNSVRAGNGTVKRILDEHFYTIELDSPFEITETTTLDLEN